MSDVKQVGLGVVRAVFRVAAIVVECLWDLFVVFCKGSLMVLPIWYISMVLGGYIGGSQDHCDLFCEEKQAEEHETDDRN